MRIVPEYLEPASLLSFCAVVRRRGRPFRLVDPLTPLQREYVVAATDKGVTVLWLRRPGVFRANVGGILYEGQFDRADVSWTDDDKLSIAGVAFEPIAFHRQDAEEVARLASV